MLVGSIDCWTTRIGKTEKEKTKYRDVFLTNIFQDEMDDSEPKETKTMGLKYQGENFKIHYIKTEYKLMERVNYLIVSIYLRNKPTFLILKKKHLKNGNSKNYKDTTVSMVTRFPYLKPTD